jgi:predicted ribonuclease YlaK
VAGGGLERIKETTQTVEADKRVVRLNTERLSTRAMLELERGALERAKRLSSDPAYRVNPDAKAAALKNRPLSEEQRAALDHLLGESRLANLEGLAGTGKSHLLGAAARGVGGLGV